MPNIALASKQRVFAVKEPTKGTFAWPVGTTDFIRPVGNATVNQNPAFADSLELSASLDVLDQFPSAVPAAEWKLSMYARPNGLGNAPQGDILFKSLLGVNVATTASLATHNAATATQFGLGSYYQGAVLTGRTHVGTGGVVGGYVQGGEFPQKGVFTITSAAGGSETVFYERYDRASPSMIQGVGSHGTLCCGPTRTSYNSTTAPAIGHNATNSQITLKSQLYAMATKACSFSLWIESDFFVQGIAGASCNQGVLKVANQGGLQFDFTGQGMQMVWAGYSTLASDGHLSRGTAVGVNSYGTLYVTDAKLFSKQARICNQSPKSGLSVSPPLAVDSNSVTGYTITAVNATNNYIVVTPRKTAWWATGDVIKGFLPIETTVGTAIEARDSLIYFNGVAAVIKSADLTVNCPKQYVTDEVGTTYPTMFMEGKRDISSTAGLYFREADAKYFTDGYAGNNVKVKMLFGDTDGYKCLVYMPKVKLQVPTVTPAAPAVELSMPMKALGTLGEDSLELSFI
jgi:hypothetical protein